MGSAAVGLVQNCNTVNCKGCPTGSFKDLCCCFCHMNVKIVLHQSDHADILEFGFTVLKRTESPLPAL